MRSLTNSVIFGLILYVEPQRTWGANGLLTNLLLGPWTQLKARLQVNSQIPGDPPPFLIEEKQKPKGQSSEG